MTLTSHLRSADSAARIFLEGVSPLLAQAKGGSRAAKEAATSLGLYRADCLEPVVTLSTSVSSHQWSSTIGTAFDYRVRMMLGDFDLDTSAAARGLSTLSPETHEFKVFSEVLEVARLLLQQGGAEELDRATIALAWCESLVRAGRQMVMASSLGEVVAGSVDGASLVRGIPRPVLDDLHLLRTVGASRQIEAWRESIEDGERYVPNPTFTGSPLVGGADADWIIGDTLFDCKATAKLTRTTLRGHLLQLLGYVLLDQHDELGLRHVAVWLPRYGETFTWDLADLLGANPDDVLPTLREDFFNALTINAA